MQELRPRSRGHAENQRPAAEKMPALRQVAAAAFDVGAGVSTQGRGWYETDFKGDQDNKRNLADRPETEAARPVTAPRTRRRTATRARRLTGRTPRARMQAPARTRRPRTRRTSPPRKPRQNRRSPRRRPRRARVRRGYTLPGAANPRRKDRSSDRYTRQNAECRAGGLARAAPRP